MSRITKFTITCEINIFLMSLTSGPKLRLILTECDIIKKISWKIVCQDNCSIKFYNQEMYKSTIDYNSTCIKRCFRENNYHGPVAHSLSYASKVNKMKRIQFYKLIATFLLVLCTVLWTDESMIRMRHNNGRTFVWRRSNVNSLLNARPQLWKTTARLSCFWMPDFHLIGRDFIFQQENALVHMAKVINNFP